MRAHNGVRTRAVPACGVRSCCVGERRESGQRHGCRGVVHDAVHGRLLLVGSRSQRGARVRAVCGWTRGGLGDAVSSRGEGSGMRGRLGWCGVRWLFQGCCPGGRLRPPGLLLRGERVGYGNIADSAYSQGSQELSASAGAS
jgi:hypothetical protein